METLEQIKELTELLSVDSTKFFKGNKSAGTRARKSAQELKALLQKLRGEILEHKKTEDNAYDVAVVWGDRIDSIHCRASCFPPG